jgi:hypothetical protein
MHIFANFSSEESDYSPARVFPQNYVSVFVLVDISKYTAALQMPYVCSQMLAR